MSKKVDTKNETISKSKQKRESQKQKAIKSRQHKRFEKLVWILIAVAVVAVVALIAGIKIANRLSWVTPVESTQDFSKLIDNNGQYEGIKALDYVTLPNIDGVEVAYADICYSDEEMDEAINSLLENNKVISEDSTKKVADGDTVNVDYVGTIDGEAFEGGTYENYDLLIGSSTFIEGFEEQLIGAKKGDVVEVNVTFPEDYSSDVAGKDAVFTVTVNGIYELRDFDDAFVKEFLSDEADTADGYKEYLRSSKEEQNLKDYIENYLMDNTTLNKTPTALVKQLQKIQRYNDEASYESMNMYYQMYTGTNMYNSFEDYSGKDETQYAKDSKSEAKTTVKNNLAFQAVLEKNGITVNADDYKAYLESIGSDIYEDQITTYGESYAVQQYVRTKAIELVADAANIIK